MKTLIFLSLILAGSSYAAPPKQQGPIGFIPMVFVYVGAEFTGSQLLDPVDSIKDCKEKLEKVIVSSAEDPSAPKGSSIIGGCVPIPPSLGETTTL